MKKTICLLLTLALALGCFSGCHVQLLLDPAMTGYTGPTDSTATVATEPPETETAAPTYETPPVPLRLQNGGEKDYLPDGYVDMVNFEDMEYERPDVDALMAMLDELTAMAERGDDSNAILEKYYEVSDEFLHFYTMDSLAYVRYTLNTNDSYYKAEYDYLEQVTPDLREKLEAFCKACAFSPSREALERDYFGYGYFDKYEDYSVFTNPEYLALAKREEELLAEYRTALEAPRILFEGEDYDYNELVEEASENIRTYDDYYRYLAILEAYYTQYNERVGSIYLELVKIRQQMAQVLGYDSYADYCYEISYERDYTHEQGVAYLEQVRTWLVPVFTAAEDSSVSGLSHFSMTTEQVENALRAAVYAIGGRVLEAYSFMQNYGLYDLRAAPEKFDSSFTTYFYDYESPFLTVNAQGTSSDYITFSHEFGHFTDNFVTYSGDEDLETAETFSQSMEFLSLCYTTGVLTESQVDLLIRLNLYETLSTFTFQSALASFEDRVYALDEKDLTLDNVNGIYRQCCKDFGLYEEDFDFFYTYRWFEVTHFFEVPYYVISYVVSADTALQVYRLEAETPGAGVAAYDRLLDRTPGDGVQAVMLSAGLDNPFREGSLEELADFFREKLGVR